MAVNLPPLGALAPVPGIRIGTACAGIKQHRRDDLAVLQMVPGTAVAGLFTRNAFRAPPVILAQARIRDGQPRAMLINSGNANAATGAGGFADAEALCEHVAGCLGGAFDGASVLPFSTGVIGERLPLDSMRTAIERAVPALSATGWDAAARAIMTTDTAPKAESVRIELDGKTVTVTGIAKGSGMIKPDMATMLAFICCDAKITKAALRSMLGAIAERSFNRITIDGDTSTNDACVLCATGYADHAEIAGPGRAYDALKAGLGRVAGALAERIVRDGEGATKFVTVRVRGGATEAECLRVAYTVAESPLVKAALFAGDPNWGRFCMAIGRAGVVDLKPERVSLALDDVVVARHGLIAEEYREDAAAAVLARDEFRVDIELGRGASVATVWTTDLSYEYVRINAEYRS